MLLGDRAVHRARRDGMGDVPPRLDDPGMEVARHLGDAGRAQAGDALRVEILQRVVEGGSWQDARRQLPRMRESRRKSKPEEGASVSTTISRAECTFLDAA